MSDLYHIKIQLPTSLKIVECEYAEFIGMSVTKSYKTDDYIIAPKFKCGPKAPAWINSLLDRDLLIFTSNNDGTVSLVFAPTYYDMRNNDILYRYISDIGDVYYNVVDKAIFVSMARNAKQASEGNKNDLSK